MFLRFKCDIIIFCIARLSGKELFNDFLFLYRLFENSLASMLLLLRLLLQLFNVSICHHSAFNFLHYGEFSRHFTQARDTSTLEIATPILIPRDDGHRHRIGSHGDVVFLTNCGEVTSYTPDVHGHEPVWQWQLQTEATWSNLPSPSGLTESGTVVPTLKPFSLRLHDNQPMILAGGDQSAVIISPGGSVLASIELPSQPTHALITDDFSNDGLTDVIVMTSMGFTDSFKPDNQGLSSSVHWLDVS